MGSQDLRTKERLYQSSELFQEDQGDGLSHKGRCVRQQCHLPGPFNGHRQFPLVFGTITGNPARSNFAPFRCEIPERPGILIIDYKATVRTKLAYFSSVISPFEFAGATPTAIV